MMKNATKILAFAVALMGIVHIVATFTPLIDGGLEVLGSQKHSDMTYMSLMCGLLLVVCGTLAALLADKVRQHAFLRWPFLVVELALLADGCLAVSLMAHNPFAWVVMVLILLFFASACKIH